MAGSGYLKGTDVTVTLAAGDLEIGAVELKNATDDTRGKVGVASAALESDNAVETADPVLSKKIGGRKLGTGGDVLLINAAGDRSVQLAAGYWRLSGNRELWFKQGTIAVAAVKDAAGSSYLGGGAVEILTVTGATDDYVHVIRGEDLTDGVASLTREE